ncbi:MAG: phenylacetate-CoA oxygenase subunit PaaJ [Proteobacteria bacterium]|nr:phenylacetate-CoA oxygenase subunit PaaJ [Pseudomonadota bacterium]
MSASAATPRSFDGGADLERAREVLASVADPEIPVLSLLDLGVIRSLAPLGGTGLEVGLSPTYTGCPATAVIRADVIQALEAAGFAPVRVTDVLAPAWTSDWISADGRRKLAAYGIAPPAAVSSRRGLAGDEPPGCPRCGSADTELVSEFGSTPCKALHRCRACREPFDRFKCI